MKNDRFWQLVDLYENKEINDKKLFSMFYKENKNNIDEAQADYKLATGKSFYISEVEKIMLKRWGELL